MSEERPGTDRGGRKHDRRSPGGHHGPQSWVGDWSGRRAALTPDRVGLVDATTGREFTYAELDRRATRTARWLDGFGVAADGGDGSGGGGGDSVDPHAGGRVAVVSRNRPEVVDLFFATGKTGGVLAPLSHRLAPPELAALLGTVDPELVVVEDPFADDLRAALDEDGVTSDIPVRSLAVDGEHTWRAVGDEVPDDDAPYDGPDVAPGDPHLFLHTGGSTGTPKETVVSHEAVVWNSLNTITAWGLRPDDVTPLTFPMFHTGGWNVVTVPLFHMGGEVVVAREFDPGQVLSVVDDRGATVLVAVPAVLRMMTEHDAWEGTDLSTLRFAKSGGGPCREAVMDAWWDRGVDLSQGYGLTECGPNNFAMPDSFPREKTDSIGMPCLYVDARVVDDDGTELLPGEVGELELASPHAGDRYWHNEAETETTFGSRGGDGGKSDSDSDSDDEHPWVSTGDLARVDEDGYFYVEGRKKNMFVSGGENVYPPEVEDVITDHPKVTEAIVVPVSDEGWGEVGKAVVEGNESLTLDGLQEFMDGRIARFKIPRRLAFIDEMPTSGPSKIDRQAVEQEFGG